MNTYIFIYYLRSYLWGGGKETEKTREREGDRKICVCIYIYIHIHKITKRQSLEGHDRGCLDYGNLPPADFEDSIA